MTPTDDGHPAPEETYSRFNQQKACRYGQMLYNVNDVYIGRSLDLYGEFSEGEADLLRQIVKPGDVVFDVGANIGTHTLFLSQLVGDQGAVLAFEPQRIVFQTLCANMALNSIVNVHCFHAAVGNAAGSILVPQPDYNQRNNFGGLELGSYRAGERVSLMTIDALKVGKCNLIKIDVEGMECAVLQGASETLTHHKPVLYVENDRPRHSAELVRSLHDFGYTMYWHRPPLYNPQNFFGNPTNVFGNLVSTNMMCIHRDVAHHPIGFDKVDVEGLA